MHYACIAPTAYLDQYAGRGHFQLCLAQVAMRDARYFEWYKRRREAGDFIILDNGAYEGELVDKADLIRISDELKPNVLTVPDKINDRNESGRLAVDFFEYCEHVRLYDWPIFMRVLQNESRDIEDWFEQLDERGGDSWIALPRVLGSDFRIQVAEYLRQQFPCNIHAFGWTGNLNEVRALAKLGVTSIDTSAPVWRGLNGFGIYDNNDEEWDLNGGPFNPDCIDLKNAKLPIVESNLQAMQRACVAF